MMVLGADMHKRSHTIAAVAAATGELRDDRTIQVSDEAFLALLEWARALVDERVSGAGGLPARVRCFRAVSDRQR